MIFKIMCDFFCDSLSSWTSSGLSYQVGLELEWRCGKPPGFRSLVEWPSPGSLQGQKAQNGPRSTQHGCYSLLVDTSLSGATSSDWHLSFIIDKARQENHWQPFGNVNFYTGITGKVSRWTSYLSFHSGQFKKAAMQPNSFVYIYIR